MVASRNGDDRGAIAVIETLLARYPGSILRENAQVERMRRAISVGRAVTVTLRNYRKDGRTFWNEVNISPLHDANGKLIHFVGILQDATNRIRTEEKGDAAV